MGLSVFEKVDLARCRDLSTAQLKTQFQIEEDALRLRLEHEFNLKNIVHEFKEKKRNELLKKRKEYEREIEYIDSLLDSL